MAWRLPSFLCAALIAVILFRGASCAYGNVSGLIAFAAFGFNLLSARLATFVRSDIPLALVIFLIGRVIWEKIRNGEPWRAKDRWIMFGLLTTGMLIKGPIIYTFLLPGIVAFRFVCRRDGGLYNAWCGWWPWLASLAIFLVWVIAGWLWVPRFYELVIVREFLARFTQVGTHVHRAQPILFYLPHLLHKFFPWSAFVIGLAIFDLRSRRWNISAALKEISLATLWLICWSIGGLVLMSLIPSKRVDRIFPVIPPLCLLLGAQIAKRGDGSPNHQSSDSTHPAVARSRWLGAALAFAILFSTGYVAARVVAGYRDHRDALSIFGWNVREEAAKNHWRYEAIGKSDEGLPLYLTRPHFLPTDRAVAEWNAGKIDALAVPEDQAPQLMRELHDATRRFESVQRKNLRRPNYVLLTH